MGKIGFVVGFGPGGRLSRLNYDLIHNGFELTEFFNKKNRIGDEPCVLFGGGTKKVIIVLLK